MQVKQIRQTPKKSVSYLVLILALVAGSFVFQNILWQTTTRTHTLLESIATFLAFFVGVIALVRYYSKKNTVFLLIGTGYLGTALLDGYHSFVTSTTFAVSYPTTLPSLITWSWMASRVFLAIILGASWLLSVKQGIFEETSRGVEILIYGIVGSLTLSSFLFFAFVPLPRQIYYPELLINRPWEFIPALFFGVALIGTLRQGHWKNRNIAHWLVLALIINIFVHVPFMSVSSHLFDNMFNLAHILKILSHICMIVGLLISTYHLFKRAEESIHTIQLINKQLQGEVAERRRAEETVREGEQQFRLLFELAPIGMAIISLDGKFLQVNQAFCDTLGYPVEALQGESFKDITHADDVETNLSFNQRLLQEEISGYRMEKRYIHKSGHIIYVILQVGLVRDPDRKPLYLIGQIVDITERKETEIVLAQTRDQALEASRLKSELLAKVSHELRTPLNAIMGFAELLQMGVDGVLSEKQQQSIAEIIDSSDYLTSLVNELLDQAQLEAGKLKLDIDIFAPTDIVEPVCSRMRVLAQTKGITLATSIADDMPATLIGDTDRLQQILANLVSNAIKFTETGTVQINVYRNTTHWAMQVSDTGSGIPFEAQAHIFEPFGQVDGSITRMHSGTGLGLSIVKQLTMLMGGEIKLESQVGQGSIFTVVLPITS